MYKFLLTYSDIQAWTSNFEGGWYLKLLMKIQL